MPRWLSSMFGSDYYEDRYRDRYRSRKVYHRDGAHYGSSAGRTVTTTHQVCSSCGKFRSGSWSARHPLRKGEIPRSSRCRKCAAGKSTSSEESACTKKLRHLHRRHKHHHRSNYTNDPYSSYESRDPCHLRRRYKTDSLGYIRPRSLVRSGSGSRVNIVIQNEGCVPQTRFRTMSSLEDVVRITRRVSVDRPLRRSVLRSGTSDLIYADEVVEEVLPKRRPLSHARRHSRSSVHFADELDEPYYRLRPRSLSRRSSVEEVIVPKSKVYSRHRRPVYFDGAADIQMSSLSGDWVVAEERVQDPEPREERIGIVKPPEVSNIFGSHPNLNATSSEVLPPHTIGQVHATPKSLRPASPTSSAASSLSSLEQRTPGPDEHGISELAEKARAVFASHDYEVDSQFPSPPSVTFALPVPRRSRNPSQMRFPVLHLQHKARGNERHRRYTEPLSPAYSNDGAFTPVSRQISYERLRHNNEPPSPPESSHDRESLHTSFTLFAPRPASTIPTDLTVENSDHPDHLAYLLSTAQIAPISQYKSPFGPRKRDFQRSISSFRPMTPCHNRDPSCYEYARAGLAISSLDGGGEGVDRFSEDDLEFAKTDKFAGATDGTADDIDGEIYPQDRFPGRRRAMHDIFDEEELEQQYYETEVDYEAEGRAYMESLKRR